MQWASPKTLGALGKQQLKVQNKNPRDGQVCRDISNKRRNSLSDRPHKISKISVLNFLTQIGSKSLYKCPPNVGGSVAVVDELLEDSCPLVAVVEEHLEDNCPNPPPNIWTIVPTHRQISGGSGIRIWRTFVYLQPPKQSAERKQTAYNIRIPNIFILNIFA